MRFLLFSLALVLSAICIVTAGAAGAVPAASVAKIVPPKQQPQPQPQQQAADTSRAKMLAAGCPAMHATVTDKALQHFKKIFLPTIIANLKNLTIPDQSVYVDTPIGQVRLDLSNVRMADATVAALDIHVLPGQGIQVITQGARASIRGAKWKYVQKSWPHVSDSGTLDVDMTLSVTTLISMSVDGASGKPVVKIARLQAQINSFDLHLHGGASWLYNIIIGQFRKTIESAILQNLQETVPQVVNQQIQAILAQLAFSYPIPKLGLQVNYDITGFNFVAGYMSVSIASSVSDLEGKVPPYKPICYGFPDKLPSRDDEAETAISDDTFNSAAWMVFAKKMLYFEYDDSKVPASFPVRLNTEDFKYFMPALYDFCPKCGITVELEPRQSPSFQTTAKDGLDVFVDGQALFSVTGNATQGQKVPVFALDVQMKLDVLLSIVNGSMLTGTLQYVNSTVAVLDSKIGELHVGFLDKFVRFLLKDVVVPIASIMLQEGFKIPSAQGVTLIDPTIVFGQNFLAVASDIEYNPSKPGSLVRRQ